MTAHDRSVTRAVARRHLQVALRQPSVLLPPVLFAVFFFVAFVGGLGAIGASPAFAYPDFKAFVFVFVALQSAAFGGVFVGVALAGDLESGAVGRLALASPRHGPILAGYVLASVVRAGVTTVALFGLAVPVGMHVGAGVLQLGAFVALMLIVTVAACLFAFGVALRLPTVQAAPLMQIPMFLVMFLAPVYTPRALMTGWVRAVADVNPTTLLLETGRALLAGDPCRLLASFMTVLLATALLAVWTARGLRTADFTGAG
jgi:ABC-2 type transport system permease protein